MTSPALATALRRIELAFANPNGRYIANARLALKLGHRDAESRARYGWILYEMPDAQDLSGAIHHVGVLLEAEQRAHDRSFKAWGRSYRPRLRYACLFEAMLVLRWVKRHCPGRFAEIVSALDVPATRPLVAGE